jgi:predicted DNA-binding protein with PD1-like motif
MAGRHAGAASEDLVMNVEAFRLTPGADLKGEIMRIVRERGFRAGYIVSCVGSLARARIRAPGAPEAFLSFEEPMEIVSLVGTLCPDGAHLHIGLARRSGECIGGHVGQGCVVHTTAELIVGELAGWEFSRAPDPETGYRELRVTRRGE